MNFEKDLFEKLYAGVFASFIKKFIFHRKILYTYIRYKEVYDKNDMKNISCNNNKI